MEHAYQPAPVDVTIDMPEDVSAVVLRFRRDAASAKSSDAGNAEYESWSWAFGQPARAGG